MNLPQLFLDRIAAQLGSESETFLSALQRPANVSLRLNSIKIQAGENEQDLQFETVPWATDAYYLAERPLFTCDPLLHAGCYYVQEPSSMLLEQAIAWIKARKNPETVLDLCAAPGGKTTHLMSLLPEDSLIVSNEVIRSRAWILAENVTKWSGANTIVTNNDPADFGSLGEFFDVMVVDAPCSGEGLFRKDEESVNQWSPENLQLCEQRQQRILSNALPSLNVGGYLVYCTCTFNPAENEEIVRWLIQEEGYQLVDLQLNQSWGFAELDIDSGKAYQAYPHQVRGEGFFLAVLQKQRPSKTVPNTTTKPRKRKPKKSKRGRCNPCEDEPTPQVRKGYELTTRRTAEPFQNWLNEQHSLRFINRGEQVSAFPKKWVEELIRIQDQLKVITLGVAVCDLKKHGAIPAHGLALSSIFNRESFPSVEVDWQTALRYLRREPIETSLPDGIGIVSYQDHPLGWVKQIGPRSNNWYPQEWRIRMPLPAEQPWSILKK